MVETGKVSVSKKVSQEDFTVEEPIIREEVSVKTIAINRYVDEPPATRHEGNTIIISVFRKVLVVKKKMLLIEEVHITKKVIESRVNAKDTIKE